MTHGFLSLCATLDEMIGLACLFAAVWYASPPPKLKKATAFFAGWIVSALLFAVIDRLMPGAPP